MRVAITERKQTVAALWESEDRYHTLFDLCPVAVYSCDASGVIEKFNRRAVELWGREPAPGDTDERFCGSFKLFRPDGSFMPHDQCPMAEVESTAGSRGFLGGGVLVQRPEQLTARSHHEHASAEGGAGRPQQNHPVLLRRRRTPEGPRRSSQRPTSGFAGSEPPQEPVPRGALARLVARRWPP